MSTEPSPVVAAAAPAPADHVPLLAGVRLFMFGARDQLNSYDLRHLSEVPDGDRPPAPADLTTIANYFRQSPSSSGGLDAVALGLCGCEVDKPVVFALRTLQYLTLHLTHRGASWASGAAQAAHFVRR